MGLFDTAIGFVLAGFVICMVEMRKRTDHLIERAELIAVLEREAHERKLQCASLTRELAELRERVEGVPRPGPYR